ncbi:MAG: PEP-CTERM sorting domain-containing protein [Chthoniobacter sp.]|nr:PEP-CTERM sorting domain-containing protein [Chthoniobacter sp.]
MKTLLGAVSALLCSLLPLHAVNWNEAIDGDLSGNNLAPTPLTLGLGVNLISGTMGKDLPQAPVDRDMFTFMLAPGQYLTSIDFLVFTPTNQSFYAIAPGATINDTDPATHLSNTLINGTGEFLDNLALGAYSGGTGLTDPVGPGTYTIWLQELSSVVTYQTAYTVVPEPGAWLSLLGGAALLLLLRPQRNLQA